MKKHLWFVCLALIFFPLLAFAEDAIPVDTAVLGLISAIKVGTLGAILLAVGQLLKTQLVSSLLGGINTKYLPYVTLVVGVLAAVGKSVSDGKPWYVGVIEGILASVLANKTFDHYAIKEA